jgi:hypothetical protein
MAFAPIDAFADAASWTLTGGALDLQGAPAGPRAGAAAVRLVAGVGAAGDRAERSIDPVDFRPFDDLQLWVRGDRVASSRGNYLVELALGASDLGVDAPSNRWRRLLPVEAAGRWQPVIVSVTDLPDRVRRAARTVRLTAVADEAFTLELASAGAVRNEVMADVEAALVARLDEAVEIDGDPVPAVVAPDQPAGGAGEPHLRIRPVAVRPAPELSRVAEQRTDHTAAGFELRPAPEPFELDYAVDAVAPTRAAQVALVELLLERVPPFGALLVNDRPLTLEWAGPLAPAGDPPVPSAPLRITAVRRPKVSSQPAVPAFNETRVEVDHGATV